jgi:hypothetical protein
MVLEGFWPHALEQSIMAAGVCGKEELFHLMVDRKQRKRRAQGLAITFKGTPPVPASSSWAPPP